MENYIDILHKYSISTVATLCLAYSIITFLRSKYNNAVRTLAYVMLLWALLYLYRSIAFYVPIFPESYALFRSNVLTAGIIFTFLTVLIPMQVLIPGWLNWQRMCGLILPILFISGSYYLVMYILDEQVEEIFTYRELWQSIGHFNVWYRFIILFCNLVYIMGLLIWLHRYEKRYVEWNNNNYSDRDDIDISWIHAYNVIFGMIFLCYLLVECFGGKFWVIVHSLVVILSFSYMFYKGIFYKSPFSEEMYNPLVQHNVQRDLIEKEELLSVIPVAEISESSFESKIPNYLETFKHWMDIEKPYLYKDFKLTDVARVLPLNRTYLSRVINEGFGKNFNEVIRQYRVEYAKEVMLKDPTLQIHQVASLSGFNSDSTFIKAFKHVLGITPNQFKSNSEQANKDDTPFSGL